MSASKDNIDIGRTADDLFAFGLRDTAGHRNENTTAIRTQSLLLYLTQAAQFRVDFFGCFFSNMAGVLNNHPRRRPKRSAHGPTAPNASIIRARVVDVHLATKCLDEELLTQRQTLIRPTTATALKIIDANSV